MERCVERIVRWAIQEDLNLMESEVSLQGLPGRMPTQIRHSRCHRTPLGRVVLSVFAVLLLGGCKSRRIVQPTTNESSVAILIGRFVVPVPSTWDYGLDKQGLIVLYPKKERAKARIAFSPPALNTLIGPKMSSDVLDPARIRRQKIAPGLEWVVERVSDDDGQFIRGYVFDGRTYLDFRGRVGHDAIRADGYTGDLYTLTRLIRIYRTGVRMPGSLIKLRSIGAGKYIEDRVQ